MKERILIVEDDIEIADIIKNHLERKNYNVTWASTGKEGLEEFRNNSYDLVILDIMLPEMDGFTLCKNIRLVGDIPVLILSAKKEELDKVTGLKIGADDYITKPFSLIELEARIESNLRRYKKYDLKKAREIWKYRDGLIIIKEEMKVLIDKKEVELTSKEFGLLMLMALNENRVFSKRELYENIWGEINLDENNTVTVHIKDLRQKLKDDVKHPKYIQTVWGTGYKFIGVRMYED